MPMPTIAVSDGGQDSMDGRSAQCEVEAEGLRSLVMVGVATSAPRRHVGVNVCTGTGFTAGIDHWDKADGIALRAA